MHKQPDDPSRTSHLMIAIHPLAVMDEDEYRQRVRLFVDMVKSTPMSDPAQNMLLPGELEYRREMERRQHGTPLPKKLYQELLELGQELGIEESLTPAAE